MQYEPEVIINLPDEQKKVIIPSFVRGDEVEILDALSKYNMLTIPLPIEPKLREILTLSDAELHNRMVSARLDTKLTWGEAVVSYYKYELCKLNNEDVTLHTSQTFVVKRRDIKCNSPLGLLLYGRSEATINEDILNSTQVSELLKKDVDTYLYNYELACKLEEDMIANMYVTKKNKYYYSHYGLTELTDTYLEQLQPKKVVSDNVLFSNTILHKRTEEDRHNALAVLSDIIGNEENVVIAGGAVFNAIFESKLRTIDLYMYRTHQYDAIDICKKLVNRLKPKYVIRTENKLILFSLFKHDKLTIQIPLRLYTTLSEVLHSLDVDSRCIGYDGKQLWATERAVFSIEHGTNTVNFDKLSDAYEYQLVQYTRYGMSVYVPDLNGERLADMTTSELTKMNVDNLMGLNDLTDPKGLKGLKLLLFFDMLYRVHPQMYKSILKKSDEKLSQFIVDGIDVHKLVSGTTPVDLPSLVITDILYGKSDTISKVRGYYDEYDYIINIPPSVYKVVDDYSSRNGRLITWAIPKIVRWETSKSGEEMPTTFTRTRLSKEQWYVSK